jgi:threonine aldolase
MLEAMMAAPTGDDVFGEDPSINELQTTVAGLFGFEAALFCPSGTQSNQIAIAVHTRPGDEVICHRLSHIYNYEGGGIARLSGASVRLIDGEHCARGGMLASDVALQINPNDSHFARTAVVSVEDTCNKGGGAIQDRAQLAELSMLCKSRKLPLHLDGARAWNALSARPTDWANYGQQFDSISLCFSKGLGAPAGSLLLGSEAFIAQAHRQRKVMGGGMRQVGLLAAACTHALNHHFEGLADDHIRADQLGSALASHPQIQTVLPVDTNIVIAQLAHGRTPDEFLSHIAQKGIWGYPFGPDRVRFVTHRDISDDHLNQAVAAIASWC